MMSLQFAEATETASGLGAFNLNLKAFAFQLLTFVIVLLVLRRWVFPKLVSTLEKRREILEQSLIQAKKTEEALQLAETKASELIKKARVEADLALVEAKKQSEQLIAKAEAAAEDRAKRVTDETKTQIEQEKLKLRGELRDELADLVVTTTEKVIQQKLDREKDIALIQSRIKELG